MTRVPNSNSMNEQEWKFDSVPDVEIELCFLYEYGRSSESFKNRVKEWRAQHAKIIAAAQELVERSGPFAFTVGPSPEKRGLAYALCESEPTPADRLKAAENGKVLCDWVKLLWEDASCPRELLGNDPRTLLF